MAQRVADGFGLDVERISINRAGKKSAVVVALDADDHPDLDLLERASRELSAEFDAAEERGELQFGAQQYTLEVTTPGVDLPLTEPRHWRRNRGRLVEVQLDDAVLHGRVGALASDERRVILVEPAGRGVSGRVLELDKVRGAVVKIEFSKPPHAEVELAETSFEAAQSTVEASKGEDHK